MITIREKRILEKNRQRFDALVNAIDSPSTKGVEFVLSRIQRAVNFAVQNDTGCFCSPEIEAKLCAIARDLPEHNEKSPLSPGSDPPCDDNCLPKGWTHPGGRAVDRKLSP